MAQNSFQPESKYKNISYPNWAINNMISFNHRYLFT